MYRSCVSNPKFWCSRLRRLWPSSAAADSNTSDIAACSTTSDFWAQEYPPPTERFAPRNASTGSTCEVIHAGAIPKTTPVNTEIPRVNSSTGPEGVAAAHAFVPDVVLCDIGLPGCNGWDVARKVQADPATAATKLVAVTGYDTYEDRCRSKEAGFEQHLGKPLDMEDLLSLLTSRRNA